MGETLRLSGYPFLFSCSGGRVKFFFIPVFFLLLNTFAICEQLQWDVGEVNFSGNKTFDHGMLAAQIQLKRSGLFSKTQFSITKLQQDIDQLKRFYRNRGFFQTEIISTMGFDSAGKTVDLYFLVDEGVRTALDSVIFVGNIIYSDGFLMELVDIKKNDILDSSLYTGAQYGILELYASVGRIFARVEYFFEFDRSGKSADLIFTINEGPVVKAGESRIMGLDRVKEVVITRELQFKPQQTITSREIRSSVSRLYGTGLFDLVNIMPLDTQTYPLEADSLISPVLIQVNETDFLDIQLGAGYNSFDKWFGTGELAYKNLFGLGHRLSFTARLSGTVMLAQLGYLYPWLFKRDLLGELNVWLERRDLESFRAFYQGGLLALNGDFGNENRYRFWTSYRHTGWFQGQARPQKNNTLLLGTSFTRDTRKSLFDPGNSFFSLFEAEIAGPGIWSNQFYRLKADLRIYRELSDNYLNLACAFFAGFVTDFGSSSQVPASELLRIGIDKLRPVRGYMENQVSPVNSKGEATGGKLAVVINLFDIRFPLFSIISGEIFADGGYVWPEFSDFDPGDLKWSIGPGLLINLPSGVFRVDYGFKLKRSFDFSGGWYFGLGHAF